MAGMTSSSTLDRRQVLAAGSLLIVASPLFGPAARAGLPATRAAMAAVLGDRRAVEGRIAPKLPEIAENGFSVPLTVEVASPMTAEDHVAALHIFADGNPLPNLASLRFTWRSAPSPPKAAS